MSREPTVFVVDDDPALTDGLKLLLTAAGLRVETFPNAQAFLAEYRAERPGCVVADIRMPGMSGLELQERLVTDGVGIPVIILTGHGDVSAAVRALKAGAVDFLEKPFNAQTLLEQINKAIAKDAETRRAEERQAEVARCLARLTPREAEILELIINGRANKVIAVELSISERTVELHRSRIMKKMQVRSVTELVRSTMAVSPAGQSAPGEDQNP
jgi:RNA polymerase sigma factor (sigma-70 family)